MGTEHVDFERGEAQDILDDFAHVNEHVIEMCFMFHSLEGDSYAIEPQLLVAYVCTLRTLLDVGEKLFQRTVTTLDVAGMHLEATEWKESLEYIQGCLERGSEVYNQGGDGQ